MPTQQSALILPASPEPSALGPQRSSAHSALSTPYCAQYSPLSPQPFVARHWLALLNLIVAVWVALPLAAPALMAAGWRAPALLIYALYQVACHQWPGRSYFLFGPRLVYSMDQLQAAGVGMARDFVGNAAMGFKVAYCERDFAIYTTVLLAGLLYAVLRGRARPLPWAVFGVCLAPIAVDGFTQLFGLRESSWELRTLTGALTGFAGVWLVYPRIALALAPSRRRRAPAGAVGARPAPSRPLAADG
ncbi:MAG TPA: DUF2085 domain-containing protein [Chloroflexota bacterium]|nr:DUF2085 domain-containing protein [Chloroflexota bacterium]